MQTIKRVVGREILDSRGTPTVEVDCILSSGIWSRASVPSGASTGIHEALELRDNGRRYHGKGVQKAVSSVKKIERVVKGLDILNQTGIDSAMSKLDGTATKKILGANAILAVSMAAARAGAMSVGKPLHSYLGKGTKIPVPYCNVINGGRHAGNTLRMQEFMIAPVGVKGYANQIRACSETYSSLKQVITKKYGKEATAVGDEGGFAPPIATGEEALVLIEHAIKLAGYTRKIKIALDVAASEFYRNRKYYVLSLGGYSGEQMMDYYADLIKSHPIISIEDPFDQDDYPHWITFTKKFGHKVQVVGDDLLVTNPARISKAIEEKWCNALLLKLNQIGTVTEAMEAASLAKKARWGMMVSNRSGETTDDFIADLAVALGSGQIKSGAPCRGERVAKYNQLLRIAEHKTYK